MQCETQRGEWTTMSDEELDLRIRHLKLVLAALCDWCPWRRRGCHCPLLEQYAHILDPYIQERMNRSLARKAPHLPFSPARRHREPASLPQPFGSRSLSAES